ncbi:MAG: LacI family DNA-binding transcriptional regulator [Lachnospiraceae bacterium]|nr:LacI family DNA-binding transcriptional regulator [Lachnospiraceae bacterium]
MPITISDVAAEAGVSKSTVSKVLNHWSTISPETAARVNAAIEKLHYIPNSRAVSFARQATQNIVYLTNLGKGSAYQNPHMFDIMAGVHHELTSQNYTLTLVDTSEETYPGERAIQEIKRRSADGLIIHGSAVNEELAQHIINENVPHIIIGHPDFENRLCWIDTDHALAGEYAAAHMIDCGCLDVLFIAGRKSDTLSNQRLKGFLKGMLDHRNHIPRSRIGYTNATRLGAYETTLHLLRDSSDSYPQAIVCENSTLALGVTKALSELSLTVPDDIELITFDLYPYSGVIDPQPTAIDINVYDMGAQAGSMMIRKLQNPDLLIQSFMTLPVLIQGKSTIPNP